MNYETCHIDSLRIHWTLPHSWVDWIVKFRARRIVLEEKMSPNQDKIIHSVTCFLLVVIFYTWKRFGTGFSSLHAHQAAVFWTFVIGLTKEVADLVSDKWPWCNPRCHADGLDVAANVIGIVSGVLLILIVQWIIFILSA